MKRRMARGVFVSACFILFAVLFCWTAGAEDTANEPERKTLFKGEKMEKPPEVSKMPDGEKEKFFLGCPALFEVGDTLLAMAEAQFKNSSGDYVGIAAVVMNEKGKWGKEKTLLRYFSNTKDVFFLLNPTVIAAEKNSVSVIFAGYGRQNEQLKTTNAAGVSWEPLIASGNIEDERENSDENKGTKYFEWQGKTETVTNGFPLDKKKTFVELPFGNALNRFMRGKSIDIQLKDGKNDVVLVHGVTTNWDSVFFITFTENKDEWKFPEKPTGTINCFDPVIINWEKNEKFMITPCDNGNYRVFESSSDTDQWDVYGGMLSGVWGNNKNRKGLGIRAGFTSAEIGGRTVAFFTQPMQNEGGNKNDYKLHLWLTDMNHTYDIGRISGENEDVRASTLLYKKGKNTEGDKLYCLYEVLKDEKRDIVFIDLTDKLEQIKKVLKGWNDVDEKLLNLVCSFEKSDLLVKNCRNTGFTKDLVSYFTDKLTVDGSTWVDEYFHMNATIKGAKQVPNGLRFSGPGAGAKWEMNTGKQNRPYHFANYEFTLVATVMIHKEPTTDSSIPLLGIALYKNDEIKRVGLWYTRERKWSVKNEFSEEPKEIEETEGIQENNKWKAGKSYQVVMSFNKGAFNLYVDKNPFDDDDDDYEDNAVHLNQRLTISHIYIGVDGKDTTDIDVTVANVFMYVRQDNKNVFDTLRKNTAISTEQDIQHRYKPVEEKPKVVTHNGNPGYSEIESRIVEPSSAATLQPPIQQPPPPPPPPPQVPQAPLPLTQAQKQSRKDILEKTKQEKKQEERSTVSAKKDVAENTENDISRGKDKEHAASVRESIAQLPTDVQSKGEIADGPQDKLSKNDVSNNPLEKEKKQQNDEVEVNLQEAKGENTTPALSSTPISPVTREEGSTESDGTEVNSSDAAGPDSVRSDGQGGDTQSAAPAAQPHGNATRVNISSITDMIAKSGGGGDGTVRERMSLALLLMGFLAFLAAPN